VNTVVPVYTAVAATFRTYTGCFARVFRSAKALATPRCTFSPKLVPRVLFASTEPAASLQL
jgi:hypothetical protein